MEANVFGVTAGTGTCGMRILVPVRSPETVVASNSRWLKYLTGKGTVGCACVYVTTRLPVQRTARLETTPRLTTPVAPDAVKFAVTSRNRASFAPRPEKPIKFRFPEIV